MCVTGCQEYAPVAEPELGGSLEEGYFETPLSGDSFEEACRNLKLSMGSLTRVERELSEKEAQEMLAPFIADGEVIAKQMCHSILNNASAQIGEEEHLKASYFMSLTSEDHATLSFLYHVSEMVENNFQPEQNVLTQLETTTAQFDYQRALACLEVAIGLAGIKEAVSVSGLISATTARQLLLTIGKRYLGYIGIAIMVYNFVDCIS